MGLNMSSEEVEVLKDRADAFLKNAEKLAEEGVQDLAAFNIEQYCRLILKYKLLAKTGTYPRTHSVIRLIREFSKTSPDLQPLLDDTNNMLYLTKIADAYIGARYLPRRYEGSEVKGMLRFIKEVFKGFVERV